MGKLRLSTFIEIDSAHYLNDYDGKCANIHGHRWKIEVIIDGQPSDLDKAGMLCDFGIIKEVLHRYDHALLVNEKDVMEFTRVNDKRIARMKIIDFNPTAENLSMVWAEELNAELSRRDLKAQVREVRVWETPDNKVSYIVY